MATKRHVTTSACRYLVENVGFALAVTRETTKCKNDETVKYSRAGRRKERITWSGGETLLKDVFPSSLSHKQHHGSRCGRHSTERPCTDPLSAIKLFMDALTGHC